MSPIYYVLVTNFCITNYSNLCDLMQQMFIISQFLWAGAQSSLAGSSWCRASHKVVVKLFGAGVTSRLV